MRLFALLILSVASVAIPANAQTLRAPFLGNGMRNSWADQTSIVVWTRTTRHAEMEVDGKPFVNFSKSDAQKLAKLTDAKKLLEMQIPEGAQLSEMLGACPGAAGLVRLRYFPEGQPDEERSTDWEMTEEASDFTAQWKIEGLLPGTRYTAIVEAKAETGDALTARLQGAFQSAPKEESTDQLQFAVTTCHDFIRRDDGMKGHKIYPTMSKMDLDFIIHAGDIEYYDKPDPWAVTKDLMRFKWGRIFALPSNRDFYSRTTSYFIKDDHDTLKNDCWVGQTYGSVSFDEGVQLFNEEQFPSRSPRYQTVRWGNAVQIWILEGRDYRSPNDMEDGPQKTILGEEQRTWLLRTLANSDAPFKLIFSPTPIVGPDRDNKKDNHANKIFAYEGNLLRKAVSRIPGAIVFCGDRHWQYASHDADTGLWEFGCGPGSEKHQMGWKKGDVRPVHRFLRVAGGFLTGEVTYDKGRPELTLRHRKVTGEEVSKFSFSESSMTIAK